MRTREEPAVLATLTVSVSSVLRRRRQAVTSAFDLLAWGASYVVAWWALSLSSAVAVNFVTLGAATAAVYLAIGAALRQRRGAPLTGSLESMVELGLVLGATTAISMALTTRWPDLTGAVALVAGAFALLATATGRVLWRRLFEEQRKRAQGRAPALIVGAGQTGRDLLGLMLRDPRSEWWPIGFLDDDPAKRSRRIRHLRVLGTTGQLEEQIRVTGARAVVVAIASADADFIQRLSQTCARVGVPIKVVPPAAELLTGRVNIRDIRDINLNDVLGRSQLDTDLDAIAGYLRGRRVLVTGAGGSIGSELCRQISRYSPQRLLMLDRDESALHATQLSIEGRALLDDDNVILCDIRDAQAVHAVFREHRPEVVFHAAALKHLPILERYPTEAIKTNVLGTRHVLEAAVASKVGRFVNVSTDKAANPTSILGYSKRTAERLTAAHARASGLPYLSVRFGNVLGSRGSVLESFTRQVSEGSCLTVTHPDVTRYFMTIQEACQLVIQAAAIGRPGEALVLEMGDPIRIADVARRLIEQSGRDIPIVYTGLRQGEKLAEDLFGDDEPRNVRPSHPLISHVHVPPLGDHQLHALPLRDELEAARRLAQLCEQYAPGQTAVTVPPARTPRASRPEEPLVHQEELVEEAHSTRRGDLAPSSWLTPGHNSVGVTSPPSQTPSDA